MNNKYQKALDKLVHYLVPFHCTSTKENAQMINDCLNNLKELVDKETPVKPKKYRDNLSENPRIPVFEEWYVCPKCEENVGDNFYCPYCGQKLDWSEE